MTEAETAKPPADVHGLAAMVAWFLAGARTQPVALAVEDLHWADPTSLDLLRSLVERGGQAPLMILATARPEFRAPWAMRSNHSVIALAPLDRAQVRRMVGEIAASHALPAEVVDGVGERTGGVPLFVEEVTRLLLERGAGGGVQTIPPTLQQSLAARLDRLGEAREVAQIGAVLGRDFSYPLLDAFAGFGPGRLQAALDRLAESDLLIVEGAPPSGSYRFKHALRSPTKAPSTPRSRRCAGILLIAAWRRPSSTGRRWSCTRRRTYASHIRRFSGEAMRIKGRRQAGLLCLIAGCIGAAGADFDDGGRRDPC